MKNKEIELKFIITEKQKKLILEHLNKNAKFLSKMQQIDTYYIPFYKNFEENGETMECLRIRECDGKNILCYKKIHRECRPVYCDEFELEIASKEQMEKILFAIGFSVQMVIDKTRESFVSNDYEFDLDSVNDKLYLFEVELKSDGDDVNKIYSFVSNFGLREKDVTYDGIQKLVKNIKVD